METWFLGWVPYALLHGHNPLFSTWINFPLGINLAGNTSMPLLGLLTAPLTLAVSPIASYNLLLWLAFPVSATSMFFVVRRWTSSTPAAFIAGLLYGFSAYSVGQGVGHVMLSFVPLPPLFFYQLHKLLVRQTTSPYRKGVILGVIAVAQFFISAEILATMAVVAFFGIVILAAWRWKALTRSTALHSLSGLLCCAGIVAVFIGYPAWFMEFGPQHFRGAAHPITSPYRIDLLGALVPTPRQRFAPHSLVNLGSRLTGGSYDENGSYVGLPLLILTLVYTIRFRMNRWISFAATMAAVSYVLSLGPRLVVHTHQTSIALPFELLARVPLVTNIIPSRLSLFPITFLSIAIGLGAAELLGTTRPLGQHGSRRRRKNSPRPGAVLWSSSLALGFLALASLIPRWPYATVPSGVPSFFTSSLTRQIPINSAVLTYPFPFYPSNQAMMWQSVAKMRFKLIGSYALRPGPDGTASLLPALLAPASVQEFLTYQDLGQGAFPPSSPPVNASLVGDLRRYLSRYEVSTVIADSTGEHPDVVIGFLVAALGQPKMAGGVAVWFDIPSILGGR